MTFSNADGSIKDKVWIDPETGAIHAVDGDFKGKVTATSGSFSGTDGIFSIKLDADSRKFSIHGPATVNSDTGFTPSTGASTIEYFSIGNFIHMGGYGWSDGIKYYYITPQIKMIAPSGWNGNGYLQLTVDCRNGLCFRSFVNGSETGMWNYGPGGFITGNDMEIKNASNIPTRNYARVNQIYIDGETLKIKLE